MCFLVFRRRKAGSKTKAALFVFLGGRIASRADDTAIIVSKKRTSPAVIHVHVGLVLPSAMTWSEKSACVANLPHTNTHARASCCFLLSWCCCFIIAVGSGAATTAAAYSLVLSPIINTGYQKLPFGSGDDPDKLFSLSSSLVTKKRNKKVTKSKESKELREGSFPNN